MGSNTYYLVPDMQKAVESGPIKESNSTFECPPNMVMIGRKPEGDENGNTYYRSAPLMVDPSTGQTGTATVSGQSGWLDGGKQSDLSYQAPAVMSSLVASTTGTRTGKPISRSPRCSSAIPSAKP